jgi:hypothetical protein
MRESSGNLKYPGQVQRRLLVWMALIILFCCSSGWAQQVPPAVTFKFDFPGSDPDHYVIFVSADGAATYDSDGKLSAQSDAGEPFHFQFTLSEPTRIRIFDLTKQAHYFAGKVDSGKKKLANTGTKVLLYKDGDKTTQATYNYSPVSAVEDLTTLFQQLSATLEFGRRLDYYRHYQKTALDDELKNLEQQVSQDDPADISAITPILQQIAGDASLMNVVRARAQRLLAAPVK